MDNKQHNDDHDHEMFNIDTPMRADAFKLSDDEKIDIIQGHFNTIMETLGLDMTDDSLSGTPRRVAKMYVKEMFWGLNPANKPEASHFKNKFKYSEMLIEKDINFYRNNGFIKLKNVFNKEEIDFLNVEITKEVNALNKQLLSMEQRDTYGKAFLQIMNIWKNSETVKQIVFGKKLAKIATELMEVEGVRLYHDQALYKEPSGGHTPWHADQFYWPLASDKTVTAWIPLQETPLEWGPLEYSAGSDQLMDGRDKEISDESQQFLSQLRKLQIS